MKEIFYFLLGVMASKLVEDNLPNFNLRRGFKKYGPPALVLLYLLLLPMAIKFTRDPQARKNLQQTLILIAAACVAANALAGKKLQIKNR